MIEAARILLADPADGVARPFRRNGNDRQVHFLRQRVEGRHAGNPLDRRFFRMDGVDVAIAQALTLLEIPEDDPPGIHTLR